MAMMVDQVGDRNRLTIGEGVETTLLLCAARPVGRAGSWPYNVLGAGGQRDAKCASSRLMMVCRT
jgi:hypothetical protein